MSVRLFVGNLPYDATEADLRGFFEPAGTLSAVIIPVDRETGKKRGFAFVEFGDPAQAAEATRRFNNQPFMGRNITINEARARGEGRPDSGPRPPMRSPGSFRPGFTPRPASGGDFVPDSSESDRSARAERRSRNFGANAKPVRKRKPSFGNRGEMGARKGPIRERVGGRVYGTLEDDDFFDDDQDLDLDLESMD